jgi:hypothetical protein
MQIEISLQHAIVILIFALSLVTASIKVRSLLNTYKSAARWESGGPTGSAGFHLRAKAAHESVQIAPWHPADRLTWAHSVKAKEEFNAKQTATAVALRAAADAADYSEGRERTLRAEVAAERRASFRPDAIVLCISLGIAALAAVAAFM